MGEGIHLSHANAFAPFERGDGGARAFEIHNTGIAGLTARKGMRRQLLSQIGARLGGAPPEGLGCVHRNGLTIIGTAPDSWLCLRDEGGDLWAGELATALRGSGSVANQSGAYVRVRLEGARAGAILQKGAYLDMHPAAFGPGAAAQTSIAHVNILLWRPGEEPAYELAAPRSYIQAFRHWLSVAGGV